jgi:diguanylate cyclase (GGDEF)-like protein
MRILIADDNPVSQRVLEACLRRWGDEVVAVADGQAAWEVLQQPDAPPLAILDWVMPGLEGPEVCRRVRRRAELVASLPEHPPPAYTYLLLLTGCDRPTDRLQALEAGADDYLVKPLDALELRTRLLAGRRIVRLQEQLLTAHADLQAKALRDPLTGLFNRSALLEVLEHELARSFRDRSALSLLLIDLDHFKWVNDTHGHLTGDAVLREAARRLRAGLRQSDWVGRYGGEEFLLVLPGCGLRDGWSTAERLRLALSAEPFPGGGGPIRVTLSGGLATADMDAAADATALLQAADDALYRAKALGRDRIHVAASLPRRLPC